jgi:hypothetical protein
MRRLFRAGLVAASAQISAVAAATVAVTIALRCGLLIPASGAAESELQSAVRLLLWIDLFLAVGIALTRNRFIDETAGRIREAARRFYPPAPDRACKALFVQLWAASAGLAASAIRAAKSKLGRVIAIGTSVVRALESSANADGTVRAGEGKANGRIARGAPLHVVDAILTGVHQPGESHYELLRAFADDRVLDRVRAAVEERDYRAHEFGDSLLIERQAA